jgi:carboxylesterase type B
VLTPAVDDLRFVAPQTAVYNSTIFNATAQPPACLQTQNAMYGAGGFSEDCLYLNVHTPAGANGTTAYLPVMVWV